MTKPSLSLAGRIALIVVGVLALAFLIYQIPPVHQRLAWRLDFAAAYLRGVVNPIKSLPTPRVVQAAVDPVEQTATPGPPVPTLNQATPTAQAPSPLPPSPSPPPPSPPALSWLPQPTTNRTSIIAARPLSACICAFTAGTAVKRISRMWSSPFPKTAMLTWKNWLTSPAPRWVGCSFEYRVGGSTDLLRRFIAAGIPVMIEETFIMAESYWPNDDRWAGHYLLVNGYDDGLGVFTAQDSFVGPNLRVSYQDLDHNWQSFNRVYILVYPPEQEETVKSILGRGLGPRHQPSQCSGNRPA